MRGLHMLGRRPEGGWARRPGRRAGKIFRSSESNLSRKNYLARTFPVGKFNLPVFNFFLDLGGILN
jgi:hypothetical protein